MHVAFIGGTGFIGPPAVRALLERGHQVSVVHRGKHRVLVPGAVQVIADRADPAALAAALRALRPDAVVDTRSMTRVQAETAIGALPAETLRWVLLSSQDVYAQFGALLGHEAPPPEAAIHEDSPLTVPYPYRSLDAHTGDPDYDKKDVEPVYREACAERGATCTVLRLPAVYGPGDPQRRFGFVLDALDAGEPLTTAEGGTWRWTHAHVRDVAHGIALAVEREGPGYAIYNLGEAETPTARERAVAMAAAAGIEPEWRTATPEELPKAMQHLGPMPNDVVVSSERARKELGYAEVTSETERLQDLIAWLRESRDPPSKLAPEIIILAVADYERAVRFYEQAFAWVPHIDVPGVFRELELPDGRALALYARDAYASNTAVAAVEMPEGGVTGTELYFRTDDLDAACARLERAGARLLAAAADKPWGDRVAYYSDPDGNVLAVGKHTPPT